MLCMPRLNTDRKHVEDLFQKQTLRFMLTKKSRAFKLKAKIEFYVDTLDILHFCVNVNVPFSVLTFSGELMATQKYVDTHSKM